MLRRIPLGLIALTLPLWACQPSNGDPEDRASDLDAIQRLHDRHTDAARNKDVEGFMATVTDSFVLIPPGHPGAAGSDAVRKWVQGFFDNFTIRELEFTSMNYTIHGDWGAAHYHYDWTVVPTGEGDPITDIGQGLYVYRRQPNGSWLIAYDTWNSDGVNTGQED